MPDPDFSILVPRCASSAEFVDIWGRFYRSDDRPYNENISLEGDELVTENVVKLLSWKAGRRFAARASEFARAIPIELLNATRLRPPLDDDELRELFESVTAHLRSASLLNSDAIIWRIFLCHVAQPTTIPIYDVNVWKAWGCIAKWLEPEHMYLAPSTIATYFDYRSWFNEVRKTDPAISCRDLDRALFAYGSLLSGEWGGLLSC